MERGNKLHVDVAVQTSPRLLSATQNLLSPDVLDESAHFSPCVIPHSRDPGTSTTRSRRHTLSDYNLTATKLCPVEQESTSRLEASPPLSPNPPSRPSLGATAHTSKRLSDPETRYAIGILSEDHSSDSSSSPADSSESDSVEIIDHRSAFNSPNLLLSLPSEATYLSHSIDYTPHDQDIRVDEEGWIKWETSSPQPIPALHGPLSLPYARCPSGAEGTVMSGISAPSQVVWGLNEQPEENSAPRKLSQSAQSEANNQIPLPSEAAVRNQIPSRTPPIARKAVDHLSVPARPPQNASPVVFSPQQPPRQPYLPRHYDTSPATPLSTDAVKRHSTFSSVHRSSPSNMSSRIIGSPFAPRFVAGPLLSPNLSPMVLSSMLALAGNNVARHGAFLPTPPHSTSPLWAPAFSPRPIQIINPNNQSPAFPMGQHRSISSVLDNSTQYPTPSQCISPEARRDDIILTHLRRSSALAADATTNRVPPTPPTLQSPRVIISPHAPSGLRKSSSMEFRYLGQSPNPAGHLRHARSLHLRSGNRRDLTPVPEEDNTGSLYARSEVPSPHLPQYLEGNEAAPPPRRPKVRVKLPANTKTGAMSSSRQQR